jgi:hypothetical protein
VTLRRDGAPPNRLTTPNALLAPSTVIAASDTAALENSLRIPLEKSAPPVTSITAPWMRAAEPPPLTMPSLMFAPPPMARTFRSSGAPASLRKAVA